MKLKNLIRIVVVVCIVLLCTGFGIYSYVRLTAIDRQANFNLYELVPQDARLVLETDRMADLVKDVNQLACSKDNHFLYVSDLFVLLKKYLYLLVDDIPHGLSKQMNKMLLSFHDPETPQNQILYCSLGVDDTALVESFMQKYCGSVFPSKAFDYKGEKIQIYSMADGRFLASYVTADFLVISFQKRLIEQVIDTYKDKTSLFELSSFQQIYTGKHANAAATLYVRVRDVEMGKSADKLHPQARVANWAEFDMVLNEQAIYCSGISHSPDTTLTFVNALRQQQPISGFMGNQLPSTTFFHTSWAISDAEVMFDFTSRQAYAKSLYSESVKAQDRQWMDYLDRYAGKHVLSCLFYAKARQTDRPCAVLRIPVRDAVAAERGLRQVLDASSQKQVSPSKWQTHGKWYTRYRLTDSTLLTQLTGITQENLCTYACFYQDALLLAPDTASLTAYIKALESKEVMAGMPLYEECIGSLSPTYSYVMTMDVAEMLLQPTSYVRLVPNFFFRYSEFFRYFMLSIQFTCVDGMVYPNLVLLYNSPQTAQS